MKLKKGDHVVYKCINPCTGWVKRVSKDGSWVDVAWDRSAEHRSVSRHKSINVVKTAPIFNRIASDPTMKVWIPEAFV